MTRAEEMRELFGRWRESGQSLMAFGKAEGVSYAKLLYWRRKFGEEIGGSVQPAAKSSTADRFVPLQVAAESGSAEPRAEKFEVWLSNGVSVEVPSGFDEAELRRLVGVLAAC